MKRFIVSVVIIIGLFLIFSIFEWRTIIFGLAVCILLLLIGIHDFFQKQHTIPRNFPVIGHLRAMLEFIRPEIRQYFIASNEDERPFNRETRSLVYQRSKGMLDTIPFGTQHDINVPGYDSVRHSIVPTKISEEDSRVLIGNMGCKHPYLASRLNISAMSFGSISKNAVLALNKGAKIGNFALNTGEGGLSSYHLQEGGDLIWQLGTAYFGCRQYDGSFDPHLFQEKAKHPQVKMIEIKLSQGAKPSHGGILPAAKITQEIADIRHIKMGEDCISPPCHSEFSTPEGLLYFVQRLRELCDYKPVGFKLAIGNRSEFLGICKAMLKTNIFPDFITIDGAEGGSGAAPLEFCDYMGEPLDDALVFVNNALIGTGLRNKICLIASGKITNGFDIVSKIALGADLCNSARGMMFALGCIQSLQCNTNTCPTGITTQNPRLMRGLVPEQKYIRVANFQKATLKSALELAGAMGIKCFKDLDASYLFQRVNYSLAKPYSDIYEILQPNALLQEPIPDSFKRYWDDASAEKF